MNDLRTYIKEASKKKREYSIHAGPDNTIPVIIKDEIPSEEVDIQVIKEDRGKIYVVQELNDWLLEYKRR